ALRRLRHGTVAIYTSAVERHLVPMLGHVALATLSGQDIERFILAKRAAGGSARWKNRPLQETSLKSVLGVLKLILARAVRQRLLDRNPMGDAEVRFGPRVESADPFSVVELRAIHAAAASQDPAFAALIRLWMGTGARLGE